MTPKLVQSLRFNPDQLFEFGHVRPVRDDSSALSYQVDCESISESATQLERRCVWVTHRLINVDALKDGESLGSPRGDQCLEPFVTDSQAACNCNAGTRTRGEADIEKQPRVRRCAALTSVTPSVLAWGSIVHRSELGLTSREQELSGRTVQGVESHKVSRETAWPQGRPPATHFRLSLTRESNPPNGPPT